MRLKNKRPRETVVNVGVKEHRKRSADETSRHGDSSSESVRVVLIMKSRNTVQSNSLILYNLGTLLKSVSECIIKRNRKRNVNFHPAQL